MKKQIMGQQLDKAMKELNIGAVKVFETSRTKFIAPYQVWEMDAEELDKLSEVKGDDWEDDYGWWRRGSSVFDDHTTQGFIINGHSIQAYETRELDEDEEEDLRDTEFLTLFDYFEYVLGATCSYNRVYVATSLAKANVISLAELLEVYQG